ncbi:ulp1 protease family, C-terminal catalytic domain-containing protein [Tanacetum coccineum]
MSGRGRGKRGVSRGAREFEGAVYEIEFFKGLPCGKNRHRFTADFNRFVEKHCNYWESWKKVKGEPYDRVWSAIKVRWNIPNDDAKKTMRKKANEAFRRFKSKLTQQFVVKKNNNPKATYGVVNMTRWDEFVVSRESEEFKLKSDKAKTSALQNKNPSRLGRTALNELEDTWRFEWDQLVLQHPWLSVIQNDRSKKYALTHLPKDKTLGTRPLIESMEGTLRQLAQKEQDMREDGTYHVLGRDPITEVFGKEHGGRTKGVSTVLGVRTALGWVKGDKERHHVVDIEAITENVTKTVTAAFQDKFDSQKTQMDSQKTEIEGLKAIVAHLEGRESPTCLDSSCASDKFDDLEDPAPCDLLWPYGPDEFRVAIGKVYPTRDATLHGSSMSEGHIKVQVDTVEDAYKAIPLPKQTDKAQNLEQSILEFIEWPRKKIKIHQTILPCYSMSRSPPGPTMSCQTPFSDLSSSSCYLPRTEENLMPFEHQMPSGGYMSLLESQGALLPPIPTSWPQMVEQPMSSHPSTTEPVEPKQTQEDRIKERLDRVKFRPRSIQGSVKRFANCKNISIVAPLEMYGGPWREWIEYEAILDLHIEAKIDITFIHWWTIDSHWVLMVLCPNSRKGYIVDSYEYEKKNENNYYFPAIVESALDTKFDWTMVKCFQQKGGWECGYYMMKFMFDLVINKQADFPHSLWDDSRRLKPLEIDQVALLTLNEFYSVVVAPLDKMAPQ